MVVATVALFMSLGGVSYGLATGSIDSREIRNNTCAARTCATRTLSSSDLGDSGRPVRKFGPVGIGLGGTGHAGDLRAVPVLGQCQANGPNTRLRVIIATTENGSAFGAARTPPGSFGPATPENQRIMRQIAAGPAAVNHSDATQDGFSALGAERARVHGHRARRGERPGAELPRLRGLHAGEVAPRPAGC